MGAADGVSAAPASETGQQWRRTTPITAQNGDASMLAIPGKEYQLTPGWDTILAKALKDDWNRMLETPMAGCERYGFKELICVGPRLLDTCNPMELITDRRQEPSRRRIMPPVSKYSFLDGPVFQDCGIDPKMFHKICVSSSDYHYPFEKICAVGDKEVRQEIGYAVGKELERHAEVMKLESLCVINFPPLAPSRPVIVQAPPVALGYQPINLEAEFPDLCGASSSSPKEPVVKVQSSIKGPSYGQGASQNLTPKKNAVGQWAFDYRNKRTNMIGKEYLNSQLDKVFQEKKTVTTEKKGKVAQPSTAQLPKLLEKKLSFNNTFSPKQPVVFLRHEPSTSTMYNCTSSVINKDGITNNFQASHGYRQWKRVKELSNNGSTSN